MKKLVFLLTLSLMLVGQVWGQTPFTATYTFGSNGNVASFAYNGTNYAGITMGAIKKVGVGNSTSKNNFQATAWPTGATNGSDTFTGNISNKKYIGFSISAVDGYKFTVTSIEFGVGRLISGTRQSQWRGSADNYDAIIDGYSNLPPGLTNSSGVLTNTDQSFNWIGSILTVGSSYEDLTGSAEFRYYLYNSEASGGTAGLAGPITISGTYELIDDTLPVELSSFTVALNLTESQLSPPTMKNLNKIPSIK